MNVFKSINKNLTELKKILNSQDIIFYKFFQGNRECVAVYVDSLTDKQLLGDLVIRSIQNLPSYSADEIAKNLANPECKTESSLDKCVDQVIGGCALIIIDGEENALLIDLKKFEVRAVTEPPTATVLKGPREGFTESIKTNLSLIRRRIKNRNFKVEYITAGKYSKTQIALCYISDVCDLNIVKTLKKSISSLSVDGVLDSSYIANQIATKKTSLFKQVGNTEKPDILSAKLLEGRVAIICDGSPICITVPYLLIEDFQSADDYYKSYYRANTERLLRFISIIFAIYLPALFVSAQLFHLQLIPLNFLLTIINSIKGIPLSPSFEMFFTLLIFEMLNEASIRMPKYVGMALSIVGALVVGDTAVRAGIVSTPTIMIMALSGICIYTVPELVDTMSFLRLTFLIIAGATGFYGILLATCFLVIYLTSTENFGIPILAPYAPLIKNDLKDSFYITYIHRMEKRPFSLNPKNVRRRKNKLYKGVNNVENN